MNSPEHSFYAARRIVEQLAAGTLTPAGAQIQIAYERRRYRDFDDLLAEAKRKYDEDWRNGARATDYRDSSTGPARYAQDGAGVPPGADATTEEPGSASDGSQPEDAAAGFNADGEPPRNKEPATRAENAADASWAPPRASATAEKPDAANGHGAQAEEPISVFRLGQNRDAPVILCEDRRTCHAVQKIAPDAIVAVVSAQDDLSRLVGRGVTIIPGTGFAGMQFIASLASKLAGYGVQASFVDLDLLARMKPGKPDKLREPPAGWTLTRAIEEWGNLETLRAAMQTLWRTGPTGWGECGADMENVRQKAEAAQRLLALGYRVIPTNGKVPSDFSWQTRNYSLSDLQRRVFNGANLGVQFNQDLGSGYRLVAFDVDFPDEALAEAVWKTLGFDAPRRFGRRPKFLIPIRVRHEDAANRDHHFRKDGKSITIQILGRNQKPGIAGPNGGKQAVMIGIHPDVGSRYEWTTDGAGRSLFDMRPQDWPLVDDLADLMQRIEAALAPMGWTREVTIKSNGGDTFEGPFTPQMIEDAKRLLDREIDELSLMGPNTGRGAKTYRLGLRIGAVTRAGHIDLEATVSRLRDAMPDNENAWGREFQRGVDGSTGERQRNIRESRDIGWGAAVARAAAEGAEAEPPNAGDDGSGQPFADWLKEQNAKPGSNWWPPPDEEATAGPFSGGGETGGEPVERQAEMAEAVKQAWANRRGAEYGRALLKTATTPGERKALVVLGLVATEDAVATGEVGDEPDSLYLAIVVRLMNAGFPPAETAAVISGKEPSQHEVALAHIIAKNAAKAANPDKALYSTACKLLAALKALNLPKQAREAPMSLFDWRASHTRFTDFARRSGDSRHDEWAKSVAERLKTGATALQAIEAADNGSANAYRDHLASAAPKQPHKLGAIIDEHFDPLKFAVPRFLPTGLQLFVGAPKLGKSWAVLQLVLAVAEGSEFWGQKCEPGDVLYLALEDTRRRLQDRVKALRPNGLTDEARERAHFLTVTDEVPRVAAEGEPGGLIPILEAWLREHPAARMVAIDVLTLIRPDVKDKKKQLYDVDYAALKELRLLAAKYGVLVLAVHHTRKSAGEDVLDKVSGSTGLTGSSDGNLIMERDGAGIDPRESEQQPHSIKITSRARDVRDFVIRMRREGDSPEWLWVSPGEDVATRMADGATVRAEIVDFIARAGGMARWSEIKDHVGREKSVLNDYLGALIRERLINRLAKGEYALASYDVVQIVKSRLQGLKIDCKGGIAGYKKGWVVGVNKDVLANGGWQKVPHGVEKNHEWVVSIDAADDLVGKTLCRAMIDRKLWLKAEGAYWMTHDFDLQNARQTFTPPPTPGL